MGTAGVPWAVRAYHQTVGPPAVAEPSVVLFLSRAREAGWEMHEYHNRPAGLTTIAFTQDVGTPLVGRRDLSVMVWEMACPEEAVAHAGSVRDAVVCGRFVLAGDPGMVRRLVEGCRCH
jgi:hypothetical protein